MAVDYSLPKPTAGDARSAALSEVDLMGDISDTVADAGSRLDAMDIVVLQAAVFDISSGNPIMAPAPANRRRAFAFDAATGERIQSHVRIPASWATVHVDFYWANAAAGAGDVTWRLFWQTEADGTDASAFFTGTAGNVVVTAGAQNIVKKTRMVTGDDLGLGGSGGLLVVAPDRNAADATDTLGNDAWLYAVEFTKAS